MLILTIGSATEFALNDNHGNAGKQNLNYKAYEEILEEYDNASPEIKVKNLDNKYLTLPECLKADEEPKTEDAAEAKEATDENGEKVEAEVVSEDSDQKAASDGAEDNSADGEEKDTRKTIYYVTDLQQQSQYINMFKNVNGYIEVYLVLRKIKRHIFSIENLI